MPRSGISPALISSALRAVLGRVTRRGPLHSVYLALWKRRQIAALARQGEFAKAPPSAEEVERLLREWEQQGRPIPPPAVYKQDTLRAYGRQFGTTIFVETGTYFGDTVRALQDQFQRLYSVELSADLARLAKERFRGDPHVTIFQGDSGAALPGILAEIREPCLFWLDGHYSEGVTALGKHATPILSELETIFRHAVKGHVILIDDARQFGTEKGYPRLEELRALAAKGRPDLQFEVKDDIIRLSPRPESGSMH